MTGWGADAGLVVTAVGADAGCAVDAGLGVAVGSSVGVPLGGDVTPVSGNAMISVCSGNGEGKNDARRESGSATGDRKEGTLSSMWAPRDGFPSQQTGCRR